MLHERLARVAHDGDGDRLEADRRGNSKVIREHVREELLPGDVGEELVRVELLLRDRVAMRQLSAGGLRFSLR